MTEAPPVKLGAIVGSLRRDSFHRIVFENAQTALPPGVSLVEIPVVDLPFFNEDLEGEDGPDAIRTFQATVDAFDGVVFFTPEYNGGVPAVTKNAVDWASRPRTGAPIHGLPILIVGATPGRHEVANVRQALAHTAQIAGGRVFDRSLGLASISRRIDDRRCDEEIIGELSSVLGAFGEFVRTPVESDD